MSIQQFETAGVHTVEKNESFGVVTDQRIAIDSLSAYVNAGGKGTRLAALFAADDKTGVTKSLLTIGQPPITLIEHQVNKLGNAGVQSVVVGAGNHDNAARHIRQIYPEGNGVHPIYYADQLGTGGDLVRAIRDFPDLFSNYVYITNSDVLLDIDEPDFFSFHKEKGADLSIAVTTSKGVPHQDAYYIGTDDSVVHSEEATGSDQAKPPSKRQYAYRGSSVGAIIANTALLREFDWGPDDGPLSLYGDIVAAAVQNQRMSAYNNGTRLFTDVGTVASWTAMQDNYAAIEPYIHYQVQK